MKKYFIKLLTVKKSYKQPDDYTDEEIRQLIEENKNRSDALKKILKSFNARGKNPIDKDKKENQ